MQWNVILNYHLPELITLKKNNSFLTLVSHFSHATKTNLKNKKIFNIKIYLLLLLLLINLITTIINIAWKNKHNWVTVW